MNILSNQKQKENLDKNFMIYKKKISKINTEIKKLDFAPLGVFFARIWSDNYVSVDFTKTYPSFRNIGQCAISDQNHETYNSIQLLSNIFSYYESLSVETRVKIPPLKGLTPHLHTR